MNRRKVTMWVGGVIGIGVLGFLAFTRMGSGGGAAKAAEPATPVPARSAVVASGRVVAASQAKVGFSTGGKIAAVIVKVGDRVAAGQVVARLESSQAEFAVSTAEASLQTARARLAEARAGLRPEERAALDAEVKAAEGQVGAAQGRLAEARASLAKLTAGPAALDVEEANRRVDQAKDALWGAQAQRDAIGGNPQGKGEREAAEARVKQSEVEVRLAEIALSKVHAAASKEEAAQARARVAQAEGDLAAAQAQRDQARANAAQREAGARPESIAVFEAQLREAEVVLDEARSQLAEMELKAPFAASVAEILANPGEMVTAGNPVVHLMDVAGMQVETTDLQEYDVARLAAGQPVTVNVLAVPDKSFGGKLLRISPVAKILDNGDATYKVTVTLDEVDPRINLGMTTKVQFALQ